MANDVAVAAQFIGDVVDLTDNTTTVYPAAAILRGFAVITTVSAQDVLILDGAVQIATIPGSAGPGTWVECGDQRIDTSLVVDPDDAATGTVTAVYAPNHDGLAGPGAGLP